MDADQKLHKTAETLRQAAGTWNWTSEAFGEAMIHFKQYCQIKKVPIDVVSVEGGYEVTFRGRAVRCALIPVWNAAKEKMAGCVEFSIVIAGKSVTAKTYSVDSNLAVHDQSGAELCNLRSAGPERLNALIDGALAALTIQPTVDGSAC